MSPTLARKSPLASVSATTRSASFRAFLSTAARMRAAKERDL
jgi:hypothetical protein